MFFPGGGIGRYTHHLASRLALRDDTFAELVCSPEYEWRDSGAYPVWAGLEPILHRNALFRRLRFLRGQFVNPVQCVRHAAESGLDVIHLSNINHLTFPLWRRALERTRLKIVATAHDVRRQKSMISRHWEDRQLKAFYRCADALFVHSEYQAQELAAFARISRDAIFTVPHGLYPHGTVERSKSEVRVKLNMPDRTQVGLFFGQIRDEKNLEGLLRALTYVASPVHLVVAGRSAGGQHQDESFYIDLARELGVQDQVTFRLQYIQDHEVAELFEASDWVALPYDATFTSQSGVLNTAAFYGRPVLAGRAPVIRETVERWDIGVTYDDDTPHSIAQGVEAIMARIQNGTPFEFASYRKQHSWEENAARTVEVYRKLVYG